MNVVSGIYKIQSVGNPQKVYIGSAMNFTNRRAMHFTDLKKGRHHSSKLQNHYNKYGEGDLEFSIIEPCLPAFLLVREQYYIDKLKPFFNSRPKAESVLGLKWSEESRKKLSNSCKGRPSANKGKTGFKMSEEFKRKRSEYMKGRPWVKGKTWKWTDEQKKKISGENNHQFGKKFSQERLDKIRAAKIKSGTYKSDKT